MTVNLTPRLRLAADYIEKHGWTQGVDQEIDGRVCLTGAISLCAPQQGDDHLIRKVLQRRGRAEGWNDDDDRTVDEVVDLLRTTEVTDSDLAGAFGPQWREIVTLVRQAATLTDAQTEALWVAALNAQRTAEWKPAWRKAWRNTVWQRAAQDIVQSAVYNARRDAALGAALSAAAVIVARDLIGTDGYTREHFQTLINPWVSVMGMPEEATS